MSKFKVGDLVVYHIPVFQRLFKVTYVGGDSIVVREFWDEVGARSFNEDYPYSNIRHATQEEIAAGRRID